MKPFQTQAHIHSLDGEMDEITVLEEVGNNDYNSHGKKESPRSIPKNFLIALKFSTICY